MDFADKTIMVKEYPWDKITALAKDVLKYATEISDGKWIGLNSWNKTTREAISGLYEKHGFSMDNPYDVPSIRNNDNVFLVVNYELFWLKF